MPDLLSFFPFGLLASIFTSDEGYLLNRGTLSPSFELFKLVRLLKLVKLVRSREKIMKMMTETFKLAKSGARIVYYMLLFIGFTHLNACTWVYIARLDKFSANNWILSLGYADSSDELKLYLSSFYFVITTITTVGYGDISGFNELEKIFCCILMILGVISFSFATGSLSSILTQQDSNAAKMKEDLNTLEKINSQYQISPQLFDEIKKMI